MAFYGFAAYGALQQIIKKSRKKLRKVFQELQIVKLIELTLFTVHIESGVNILICFFVRFVSFKFLCSLNTLNKCVCFKPQRKKPFCKNVSYENEFLSDKTRHRHQVQPLYLLSVKTQRRFIQNKYETFIIKFSHNHIGNKNVQIHFRESKRLKQKKKIAAHLDLFWCLFQYFVCSRAIFLFLFRFASHLLTQSKSILNLAGYNKSGNLWVLFNQKFVVVFG